MRLCPFPDCKLGKFLGDCVGDAIVTRVDGKFLRERTPIFDSMVVKLI